MQKISDHISRGFVQVLFLLKSLSGQWALEADSPSVLTAALADLFTSIIYGYLCD